MLKFYTVKHLKRLLAWLSLTCLMLWLGFIVKYNSDGYFIIVWLAYIVLFLPPSLYFLLSTRLGRNKSGHHFGQEIAAAFSLLGIFAFGLPALFRVADYLRNFLTQEALSYAKDTPADWQWALFLVSSLLFVYIYLEYIRNYDDAVTLRISGSISFSLCAVLAFVGIAEPIILLFTLPVNYYIYQTSFGELQYRPDNTFKATLLKITGVLSFLLGAVLVQVSLSSVTTESDLGFVNFLYPLGTLLGFSTALYAYNTRLGFLPNKQKQKTHSEAQQKGLLWDEDPRLDKLAQMLETEEHWFNKQEEAFIRESLAARAHGKEVGRRNNALVMIVLIGVLAWDAYYYRQQGIDNYLFVSKIRAKVQRVKQNLSGEKQDSTAAQAELEYILKELDSKREEYGYDSTKVTEDTLFE